MTERDIDDLPRNTANYTALTPLWFLERAATVYPNRKSLIHGSVEYTWQQTYNRCRQLASALNKRSVTFGSTGSLGVTGKFAPCDQEVTVSSRGNNLRQKCKVAVIAPNAPALYEGHFGIPMAGAVLNAVNVRLNAQTIAFLLGHCSAAVVMVDQEYFTLAEEALKVWENNSKGKFKAPLLIVIADKNCDPIPVQYALEKGAIEYEKFLETGDPGFSWKPPEDEWQTIDLGYTSGTTASPKGVVLHHRGAYLMAISNAVIWSMQEAAVYLWTLPLFHCNGWCFIWTLAAICGTNICLRQVTAKAVYSAIVHLGVTHFSAAPVHSRRFSSSICSCLHTYGRSETYGPSTLCTWKPEWDLLPPDVQARLHARQGVRYVGLEHLDVVSTKDMKPVPADGKTVGEIVFRVKHPDGYIEIKDRSKDIIIPGGENISSVEVENILYLHPAILEVSVVARPDEQWDESPYAFVTLKPDVKKTDQQKLAEDIINFSRSKLPKYWVPKSVVFGPLPKTATGKIQKHLLRTKAKEMRPVKKSRL
ncbi:hypothetical protein RND71_005159 [Anisodus tanguticus]|uniref:Uncharacterized protein n=1 Tax=Anisodus tanguticus TaxID=243964 RepID=A0AAE1VMD8_9SOLA|nr:hypothetical protein RND71_005159 [Anisodus tanguticus]